MRLIEADAGEVVYDFLKRMLNEVNNSCNNAIMAKHNGTIIIVYKESLLNDLCDKFDLQRKINNLKGE